MFTEYCPVSLGVGSLGERWSLLIVREILTGAHRFNEIHRGLPGLSRTLLSQRLRKLERLGIVRRENERYELTEAGEELREVIMAFGSWTAKWMFPRPTSDQSDPRLLLWRMRSGLRHEQVPNNRVTIRFDFSEPAVRGWLVIERQESTVCFHDPLFEIDLEAAGPTAAWYETWYGHRDLTASLNSGLIQLDGRNDLVREFPHWFSLSPFAEQIASSNGTV